MYRMQKTPSKPATKQSRRDQAAATRTHILKVATQVLVSKGVAATTTLEVQKCAEVSRGALLHHFPTHATLLSATVGHIVELNEQAVWVEAEAVSHLADPLARGVWALANAYAHPSFVAELELWTVARTDERLRAALRLSEREVAKESQRVLNALFGPLLDQPAGQMVVRLSMEFIRGLTISTILRDDVAQRQQLIEGWINGAQQMLART